MRHTALRLLLLAVFAVFVAAWSKEDHEIFRLRQEVIASEGHNVTFYDFLGIKPNAKQTDIVKAYRKKSKLIHPDKAKRAFIASRAKPPKQPAGKKRKPGVHVAKPPSEREIQQFMKEANERFARLGIIADILKGSGRERYDHFLKNGFPKWKGTGYYYSRFRPGLGSVLIGLFLAFGGAAHYGALVLSWKRQVEFVDRYIRHARRSAWGDDMGIQGLENIGESAPTATPAGENDGPVNRRQKRMMERENRKGKEGKKEGKKSKQRSSGTSTPTQPAGTASPTGNRRRVTAENGKVLIVDSSGNVFLEDENEDGELNTYLLDINEIPRPTIKDTMVYRLPFWVYRKTVGRLVNGTEEIGDIANADEVEVEEEYSSVSPVEETATATGSTNGSSGKGSKSRNAKKRGGKK